MRRSGMSREYHFGDEGRAWGCQDPRPQARTDEHTARVRAAALARKVAEERR
jgi:hypothetical protein